MKRVTLDGKETSAEEVAAKNAATWAELQKKYEEDKKKDPDFAIPPSEDALARPQPKRLWQVGNGQGGQKQWHVDAAIAATGDKVLAASAFLDVEKQGDRALYCLGLADGATKWRVGLTYNPWAGPSVSGDMVVVGCSSIRFEPKDIPTAKGEVLAVKLGDGSPLWKQSIPGGVVSSVAIAGDAVVFAATDGKVRALAASDGKEKWTYNAKAPMFAGVAVAGDLVYAADLKGVVHAIGLGDGKLAWTLNLATDPAVRAPGMVYGSPVVHEGRLYVCTSNLESGPEQTKTVVVCIGEK